MSELYDYETYQGFLTEDKSILRDPRGVQRTETLFHGMNKREEKYPSIYSLAEEERRGLPSAYQIYIHSIDEREGAMKIFGSLKHWRKMLNLKWFREGDMRFGHEGVIKWREDMAMRDISLAKSILLKNAKKGDTSAARKILDEYKGLTPSNKVGRPKNGETVENTGIFDANKIAQIHSKRFGE